jgi:hypothetical protein
VRLTAELNAANDVTVTVSVAELPDPTERADELNDSEKSLPEAITSTKDVVWVAAPTPLKVIILVLGVALDATLIPRVAETDPPEGIMIGLGVKVENVTPAGTEPVTDSVTGPEKLRMELPVTATLPEAPCAIVTVPGDALRPKSGVESVSFATLLVPDSSIQTFPEESTLTSCGVLAGSVHSVN